jgi:hypothetical protein
MRMRTGLAAAVVVSTALIGSAAWAYPSHVSGEWWTQHSALPQNNQQAFTAQAPATKGNEQEAALTHGRDWIRFGERLPLNQQAYSTRASQGQSQPTLNTLPGSGAGGPG